MGHFTAWERRAVLIVVSINKVLNNNRYVFPITLVLQRVSSLNPALFFDDRASA